MELIPYDDAGPKSNLPWSEMFRSASLRRPPPPAADPPPPPPPPRPSVPEEQQQHDGGGGSAPQQQGGLDPQARVGLYIAMAHAGLALSFFLFYGLYQLLEDFVRPTQWAFLCSIPLREIQTAVVFFWSGPAAALLAVPAAAFRLSAGTLLDARLAFSHALHLRRADPAAPPPDPAADRVGFERLTRWLAAFTLFVLAYEQLGCSL